MNGVAVEQVENTKLLGFTVDCTSTGKSTKMYPLTTVSLSGEERLLMTKI